MSGKKVKAINIRLWKPKSMCCNIKENLPKNNERIFDFEVNDGGHETHYNKSRKPHIL